MVVLSGGPFSYLSPCSSAQANTAPSAPYTNPFLFPIGISSPLSSVRSIVPPGVYTYSVATLTLLSTYNTGLSNPTCLHPQPTQALQSPTLGSTLTYRLAPKQSFSEHSDLPLTIPSAYQSLQPAPHGLVDLSD